MLAHARHAFNLWYNAYRQARSNKRLDICAAQFAHVLHLAGNANLRDKVCLEIGAGRVLTHAVVCHLLGARRVIAIDLHPIACPRVLRTAIRQTISSIPRDILSPFEDHGSLRARMDALQRVQHFDAVALAELGIEYRSPVDICAAPLGTPVDFIYSWSVLQHVPKDDVPVLFANLMHDLTPGGAMLHAIHLEDIQDFARHPLDFLSIAAGQYTPEEQNRRGNRLRASSWISLLSAQPQCRTRALYAWQRPEHMLPAHIDSAVHYTDTDDLRTSHLGLWLESHVQPV